MKKIILTLLIFGAVSTLSFAQSTYLEKGQNGFEISSVVSANENASGFTGRVGYSFSGVFDLSLSLGRFGYDQQFLGEDLYDTEISPVVTYIPVKQDDSIPVSFAVNGAYQRLIYAGDGLDENNVDMWGDYIIIGASIFSDIEISDAMKFQPKAGVLYSTGETKIEDSSGTTSISNNTTVLNIGVSLIFKTSPGKSFVVNPSIGIQEDFTTYRLSLGFVLPHN